MRALTVVPGRKGSLSLDEADEPDPEQGTILAEGLAVGVCGTDREIVAGDYGWAPEGEERLVIGHESLGRVREAPTSSGFAVGDLIVGWCVVLTRCRAGPALVACSTCVAMVATRSGGSRRSTGTRASCGGSSPITP